MPTLRTASSPASCAVVLLLAALLAPGVSAQQGASGSTARSTSSSWHSGLGRGGYLGLNVGRSTYRTGCGLTTLGCDDEAQSVHLYAGTMLGRFWGAELGLLDMGRMDRGGGRTRAQGLNVSLVGRAPIGASAFGVFGKVGTTYGHTDTSSVIGSGIASGDEKGFGLSYGAGVSYDFSPRLTAVLEWDSHDFRFAGGEREPVRAASIGLQWRY